MLTRTKTSKWMVESIYFLKPAWCGTHPAGLWPEQGLQPVTRATALRRWFLTYFEYNYHGGNGSGFEIYRVRVRDRKLERLANLKGVHIRFMK